MRFALLIMLPAVNWSQVDLGQILSRVSEEAEVFRQQAPRTIAEETLVQRAVKPEGRLHPRLGQDALKPRQRVLETREIVSEYTIGSFQSSPQFLHEFRQVVTVDGRKVNSREKARHALTLGISSADDQQRRRMLEEFQKYGLRGASVDLAPMILLFTKRQIPNFRFSLGTQSLIGAEQVQAVNYEQVGGSQNVLIVEGRRAVRQPLRGQILVRARDGLPLRVTMVTARTESGHAFRDEATIDYVLNPRGFLAPVSVVHRGFTDDQLMVEDTFRYADFKKFAADAEIKFTEVPEMPQP